MSFQLRQEHLADLQWQEKYGGTHLHKAAQRGDIATLIGAAAAGCSLKMKSQNGLLPLHEACLEGQTKAVHLLLALGSGVNVKTAESWTPLICAAGNGHLETTKILLASGADPDSTTSTGHSAAHMAAWKGLTDILVVLGQNGCSLNIKNDEGLTSLDLAVSSNQQECVTFIKAAMEKKELEDSLRREYNTKLQLEKSRNVEERHRLHVRIHELELSRILPTRKKQHSNNLVRSSSLPLDLSSAKQSPPPPSPHRTCHSSSPLCSPTCHSTSPLCSPSSKTKSPSLSLLSVGISSPQEVLHISPSPPTSPRPRQCLVRQGMAMSPLARRRELTSQPTSPIDYHRSKSVPLSLDITAMSDARESDSVPVASIENEETQTEGDTIVSQNEWVDVTRTNERLSRLQWIDVAHKREFFSDKWSEASQNKDELLMKIPFTELHKQSLQNPNSMANITRVATL